MLCKYVYSYKLGIRINNTETQRIQSVLPREEKMMEKKNNNGLQILEQSLCRRAMDLLYTVSKGRPQIDGRKVSLRQIQFLKRKNSLFHVYNSLFVK